MNTSPSRDESRPVVLRQRDVQQLRGLPAMLRRKSFNRQADVLDGLIDSWDGAAGFVVVHEDAFRLLPTGAAA